MIPRGKSSALRRAGVQLWLFALGVFSASVLWFHAPSFAAANVILSLAALALSFWAGLNTWRAFSWMPIAVVTAVFSICVGRLAIERPRNDRTWSPEMAAVLSYVRVGNTLTIRNVRNFDWTSQSQADERWETRSYDLSDLKSLDIASLYWKGPFVAHTYFSFVWADGSTLSLSVEIRKEKSESYSEFGGLFRAYELAVLAGDERDFYGWRVHAPGEDIQLFRTMATPDQARRFLLELLDRANTLAARPEFYNTLTNNCSTEIAQVSKALGADSALDWRNFVTGFVPELLHKRGILDASISMQELRARGRIIPAARIALSQGLTGADFARAIRSGLPPAHR